MVKILGLAGSLRKKSFNRMLLRMAVGKAKEGGAKTEIFDLNAIPVYNQDVEDKGYPKEVVKLRRAVENADGLIIATPEYNHSYSGVLKNAIDWLSRPPKVLKGKTIAVLGASTGRFGSVRAQRDLKPVLSYLDNNVLPQPEVMVSNAEEVFDEKGMLNDKRTGEQVEKLVARLLETMEKHGD